MKRELLSSLDSTVLPELAVLIFITVFILSVIWMYRPGAREFYAQRALLPLDDDAKPLPGAEAS